MKKKAFRTIPRILRINSVDEYRVSCIFSNGEHRIIDFEYLFKEVFQLKEGSVAYPLLQDPKAFAQMKLEGMNLIWPNVGLNTTDENGEAVFYPYEPDPLTLYQHSQPDNSNDIDIAAMIKRLRKSSGMTQTELAEKSGTTKQYISRLENNHADIELMTLKRIIEGGLGKQLEISIK